MLWRYLPRETVRENWIGQLRSPTGKSIGPQAWETSVQFRWAATPLAMKITGIIGSEDVLPRQLLYSLYLPASLPPDLFNTLRSGARLLCGKCNGSDKNEVV